MTQAVVSFSLRLPPPYPAIDLCLIHLIVIVFPTVSYSFAVTSGHYRNADQEGFFCGSVCVHRLKKKGFEIWVKTDVKAGIKFAIIFNTHYDVYSLKSTLL